MGRAARVKRQSLQTPGWGSAGRPGHRLRLISAWAMAAAPKSHAVAEPPSARRALRFETCGPSLSRNSSPVSALSAIPLAVDHGWTTPRSPLHSGDCARERSGCYAERKFGAGEGARTLDPDLGKVVLYH